MYGYLYAADGTGGGTAQILDGITSSGTVFTQMIGTLTARHEAVIFNRPVQFNTGIYVVVPAGNVDEITVLFTPS